MINTRKNDIFSVHHDGSSQYVKSEPGVPINIGSSVRLEIRANPSAHIERILLRTCPDGEQFLVEMELIKRSGSSSCSWWESTLRISMPVTGYRFLIMTKDDVWWYNASGPHRYEPTDHEDFKILANYDAPEWVRKSVFYQIFPDRFADGDPESNVRDGEFEYFGLKSRSRRWGDAQSNWPDSMVEFYGGDLCGVEEHLDYLDDLGVNAIYLNPIFSALSNHRYDVIDYENVDQHLGGNEALISLRNSTRMRGMRLILDIVPNHCGVEHTWFKAAQRDKNAATYDYFTFNHYPDNYESWLGVRSLPKLNYRSQHLREAIYQGSDSVFRRWLKEPFRIDGWRVDVANMLGRHGKDQLEIEVWAGIRTAVKEENPSAYLLGENFFDGSPQLQGDSLDATMNYAGFTRPLEYWLSRFTINQHGEPHSIEMQPRWPTEALIDSWQASRAAIPWVIACQQFNLLGSHDTPRILSAVNKDPGLNRLAFGLMMTYVGVPCIYYGDEIGMVGENSLEARNCMIWDDAKWDKDLRSFCQKLIKLRRTSPALINGGFQVLLVEEDALAFLRETEDEQIIVIANRGPEEKAASRMDLSQTAISDGTIFQEIFSGQTQKVKNSRILLPAIQVGVQIWKTT